MEEQLDSILNQLVTIKWIVASIWWTMCGGVGYLLAQAWTWYRNG